MIETVPFQIRGHHLLREHFFGEHLSQPNWENEAARLISESANQMQNLLTDPINPKNKKYASDVLGENPTEQDFADYEKFIKDNANYQRELHKIQHLALE